MRRLLVLLSLVALLPALPAQTLINSLPAETLVYYRVEGGFDEIRSYAGNNGIWNSPLDLDSILFKEMDKGLEQLSGMIGAEAGSLRSYIRSFTSMEAALLRFDISDDLPEADYVVAFETPMADQIFKLASGALVKQAFGEMTEDGAVEVPLEDDFGLHIAQQKNKIIIASDAARLRETMGSFGKVVPGNLAQTKQFKAATGGVRPKSLVYVHLGFLMGIVNDFRTTFEGRGGRGGRGGNAQARDETWRALGMHRLTSLGFIETETYTRLAVSADGPVIPFKMLASRGNADLLASYPADTAVGMTWTGNTLEVWNLFAKHIVTNPRIEFAPYAAEWIRSFQKDSGLKVEQVAEVFDRGIAMGMVPDGDGRLGDDGPTFIARTSDPAKARSVAQQLMEKMGPTDPEGRSLMYDEGETTFLHPEGRRGNDPLTVALDGDAIFVGADSTVRKTLAAYRGEAPSLKSSGTMKGLKPLGSAYMFLHFQPIFAQESEFTSAYSNLLPGAGMAATIKFTEDSMTLTTSRRLSETISTFALAAAQDQAVRSKRRECEANLKKIKEAYDLYLGKHTKHPTSLAQLGFSGEEALVCPLDVGGNATRTPYQLFPGENQEDVNLLRACCGNLRHGRLTLDRRGRVRRLSQVQYKQHLRNTRTPVKDK